jgi:hypothetical protein
VSRIRVAAITTLVAAFAAGCGGGSERLSKTELVQRAGRICTDQARTIAKIPRGPATAENAAGYTGAVLSVVEGGVKRFHRLEPPKDVAPTYAQFLRELDRNVDILRTIRAAAAARVRKAYLSGLSELHRSRVRINMLERRLGLTACESAGA